jgi:hypothetical protein
MDEAKSSICTSTDEVSPSNASLANTTDVTFQEQSGADMED